MQGEKVTLPEWKERYRVALEVDRIERQHALQHFRNHWRSIVCDQLVVLMGNAVVGFAGGLAVAAAVLVPVAHDVGAVVSKVCGS